MSNRAFDALGRIPPSPTLAQTLNRAADYARHQSHRRITLEHVLLSLCDDPDAARVLAASRVDVRQIMIDASGYVGRIEDRAPQNQPVEPVLDGELARMLDYATVAAEQGGRRDINGAILLAAIVGEERSAAATILKAQGLTFEGAISSLRQTATTQQQMPQPIPAPAPAPAPAAVPHFAGYASSDEILASVRDRIEAGRPQDVLAPSQRPPQAQAGPAYGTWTEPQPPSAQAYPAPEPYPQATPHPPDPRLQQPPWQPQPAYTEQAYAPRPPAPQPPAPQPYAPQSYAPPPYAGEPVAPRPPQPTAPALQIIEAPDRRDRTDPSEIRRNPARRTETSDGAVPLREVDPQALARSLPGNLAVGQTETVEIRIARADVASLGISLTSQGPSARSDLIVSRSLTLRLRCPDSTIMVETISPETQWIQSAPGPTLGDDALAWRWMLTGRRAGNGSIQLSVRARTVAIDGTPVESALPDLVHAVRIAPDWVGRTTRVGILAVAFVIGVAVAISAGVLFEFLLGVSKGGP